MACNCKKKIVLEDTYGEIENEKVIQFGKNKFKKVIFK